jgi:hypothetical protein
MAAIDIAGGGNAQFVSGDYLSAYDTKNYSIGSPYEIATLSYDTVILSSGITIPPSFPTDITFSKSGIYNLQFSCQVTNNSPQIHLFYLWLCKNNNPVADTNSVISVTSTHGGNNGHLVPAWNFVFSAVAGDTFQLCWSAEDTAIRIQPVASPAAGIPASPSVILSVQQI